MLNLQRMLQKTREDEQKALLLKCSQPQDAITSMVKRGILLGDPQYINKEMLSFEYYLVTMKIISEYSRKHI